MRNPGKLARDFVRDVLGASVSAFVTGLLFLGPGILAFILAQRPIDMDALVREQPPPVQFEAAFALAEREIDGDLDGTQDVESATPEAEQQGEGGQPDGDASSGDAADDGADIAADPSLTAPGKGPRIGPRAGGKVRKGTGGKGRKKKRSRRRCPRSYDGVRRRADGVYEIRRSLVDYHTSSISRFNELGWSRANKAGKGWVIAGFDCRGALWHGGFRRGDVILAVNGKKTNNMLQILRLYPKLKRQTKFEVELIRRGRHLRLHFEIVPE